MNGNDLLEKSQKENDETGLPPFVSTWGGFYALVLSTEAVLILLFFAIQAYFR
ncbi:MAG: hypothetical protein M3Y08_03975 [Fibrobacterota bacterium]|nr:hypothetical protein [Fibrobacterota bacterium]